MRGSLWCRPVLAAVSAMAAPALATVVMALSVEELTERVPVVVKAKALASQAAWDEHQRQIWTYTELSVTETLKGAPGSTLLVKQPGGVVAGTGVHVDGAARFTEGEQVLLFLEPATDEAGVFVVAGLAAGKFSLEERKGGAVAVRRMGGLALAKPGEKTLRKGAEVDVEGPAEALLGRVRTAVARGKR